MESYSSKHARLCHLVICRVLTAAKAEEYQKKMLCSPLSCLLVHFPLKKSQGQFNVKGLRYSELQLIIKERGAPP